MLEIDREERHNSSQRLPEGTVIAERTFGARNIVYGAVCTTCNNGWMSHLEGQSKPIFERLFRVQPTEISGGEARTLSRWAYKTSVLLALTADETSKKLVSVDTLSEIRTAVGTPYHVQVSLLLAIPSVIRKADTIIHVPGFIQTEPVNFSRNQFGDLVNATAGYVVMLQFGHIVLRVTSVNPREAWQMMDENRTPFYSLTSEKPSALDWPPKVWPGKKLLDLAHGVVFRLRT